MNTKQGLTHITGQITQILGQLSTKQMQMPLDVFNGSSVGKHFRHIYDYYACILKGMQKGCVDYADRSRDEMIESNPVDAIDAFNQVLRNLLGVEETWEIGIITDFSGDPSEERQTVDSTLGRELLYAHDHALHHLAIIKIGIQSAFPDLILNEEVGVAPSTLKYLKSRHYTEHSE